jgi:tetratricopeptide (TPR) repeat protein
MGMPWNPKKQNAQYAKAAVLVAMGRFAEGLILLPKEEPKTRDEWIAYHIRGMILLRTGNVSDAITLLERGLRENPFADQHQYFENALAVANLRLKRFEHALRFLGQAQTSLSDVIRIHAFGAARQLENARKAYQRVESACPAPLASLRDTLAARYGLKQGGVRCNWNWVFEEECRNLLYAAA